MPETSMPTKLGIYAKHVHTEAACTSIDHMPSHQHKPSNMEQCTHFEISPNKSGCNIPNKTYIKKHAILAYNPTFLDICAKTQQIVTSTSHVPAKYVSQINWAYMLYVPILQRWSFAPQQVRCGFESHLVPSSPS